MTTYFLSIDTRADAENCLSVGSREDHENSVPFAVWHGLVKRYDIPYLKDEAQRELLDEAQEIAEDIWAEITEEWDGSNFVGKVADEEALEEAEERLEKLIASYEDEEKICWDAADWFQGIGRLSDQADLLGITPDTTDEQLAEIAEREERAAEESDECDELNGTLDHLRQIRSSVQDAAIDELDARELARTAMAAGVTDFVAAAEAAIPEYAGALRADLIAEFVEACEEIYQERAENPSAAI